MFRGIAKRPTWPELRNRLVEAVLPAFPEITLGEAPVLSWHEASPASVVAAAVGQVPGWDFVPSLLADAPPEPGRSLLVFDRTFSEEAWAVAVVRYHATYPRPYSSGSLEGRARLWALVDVEAPTRSGYPLTDAIAALLLDEPAPPDAPDGLEHPADRLAWKLSAVGYDRLWSRAWAATPL